MNIHIATAVIVAGIMASPLSSEAAKEQLWTERRNSAPKYTQIPDFAALAEAVMPGVVSISVEQKARVSSSRRPGMSGPEEFFFRFFGQSPQAPQRPEPMPRGQGIGTGFVIQDYGLILTNFHVVENADTIRVTLSRNDGSEEELEAKILGVAPEYDVALIQTLDDANAEAIPLGASQDIRIGDWVMAVGNPFGLSQTVSTGIISAKERRDIAPSGRRGIYNFLQTDASINPGNSGGPLINVRGEVIGINTAINAAGSGIGFAIPIDMVKEMLPDLKAKGRFVRSWIGIKIQPLDEALAESLGLRNTEGALIAEIISGGPAEAAGLREGDVITEFNGERVRESSDLPLLASLAGIGREIPIRYVRDQKFKRGRVTLKAFPEDGIATNDSGEAPVDESVLGMSIGDITDSVREQFQLRNQEGAAILKVTRGGLAARAGIRQGDVIVKLNGQRTRSASEFMNTYKALRSGQVLRLLVARDGGRLYLAIRKP